MLWAVVLATVFAAGECAEPPAGLDAGLEAGFALAEGLADAVAAFVAAGLVGLVRWTGVLLTGISSQRLLYPLVG